MKSPHTIAVTLRRQWQKHDVRIACLLHADWPVTVAIGRPSGRLVRDNIIELKKHIQQWQGVTAGQVQWRELSAQALAEPVQIPHSWQLNSPSEWVAAMNSSEITDEFERLGALVSISAADFHEPLIRYKTLLVGAELTELQQLLDFCRKLQPNMAQGRPLRALAVNGNDSKFFERFRMLIIRLLDARFNGAVSEQGLEVFLGAAKKGEQWLLLVPLDNNLLPFQQLRIRASELASDSTQLPGSHILIVENEQCLHQLPALRGTLAILGAGLNLNWLSAPCLYAKYVAYWGDLDTWGLTMLAKARQLQPRVRALLMTSDIFHTYSSELAVVERSPSQEVPLTGLIESEIELYKELLVADKGRIEQEFLPDLVVQKTVSEWHEST